MPKSREKQNVPLQETQISYRYLESRGCGTLFDDLGHGIKDQMAPKAKLCCPFTDVIVGGITYSVQKNVVWYKPAAGGSKKPLRWNEGVTREKLSADLAKAIAGTSGDTEVDEPETHMHDLVVNGEGCAPGAGVVTVDPMDGPVERLQREVKPIQRFQESEHSTKLSTYDESRKGGRHERVRDESYVEVKHRADELELKFKAEAASTRALAEQLQQCVQKETSDASPEIVGVAGLLQQAVIHIVDEKRRDKSRVRMRVSAAGLAAGGTCGFKWCVDVYDEGEDDTIPLPDPDGVDDGSNSDCEAPLPSPAQVTIQGNAFSTIMASRGDPRQVAAARAAAAPPATPTTVASKATPSRNIRTAVRLSANVTAGHDLYNR